MAKQDKEKWLKAFFGYFGYQPANVIRKRKDYNGISDLKDALEVCSESEFFLDYSVRVIIPFKSKAGFLEEAMTSDCVVIYPQLVKYRYEGDGPIRTVEIERPIQYKRKLYSFDEFVKRSPRLHDEFEPSKYSSFSFPLNFFNFSTKEFSDFQRAYLSQIREFIFDTCVTSDMRGKNKKVSKHIEERNNFILKEYKLLGEPKRLPVDKLHKALTSYLATLDKKWATKMYCNPMTIRRVLKANIK